MKKTAILILLISANFCFAVADNNLVAWYKMDENEPNSTIIDEKTVSTHATLTTPDANVNKKLEFTAVTAGSAGNDISVKIIFQLANGASVVVSGNFITISRKTTTGTAAVIKTAWDNNAAAVALATCELVGDGSLVPDLMSFTGLSGGIGANFYGTDSNTSAHHTAGQIDGALSFNGTTDYIDTGQTFESTFQNSFTISLWWNSHSLGMSNMLMYMSDADSGIYWNTREDGEGVVFGYGVNAVAYNTYDTGDLLINTWYMETVVITKLSDTTFKISLYRNGNLIKESAVFSDSMSDFDCSNNLYIGAGLNSPPDDEFWDGFLDDVRIYNRALSPVQIRRLYRQGRGGVSLDWLPVRDTKLVKSEKLKVKN